MADAPLSLSEVLREEYVRLHGALPADTAKELEAAGDEKARLKAIYAAIHRLNEKPETARTALCISGGGIRSATFALGVLQRLASFGLLAKFHFLSTVSGGGYIGSWLSSFARRDPGGMAGVQSQIQGIPAEKRDPRAPEIEPLRWLRSFSNYLTPKLGLFSGDTWAFAGSYVRNLILVWLMFVPFLAALLALPRLAIAYLRAQDHFPADDTVFAAGVCILIGTGVIALTRPVAYRDRGRLTNNRFLLFVLLPYAVAAILIAVYWAAIHKGLPTNLGWPHAFIGLFAANALPALIYMARFFRERRRQRASNVRRDSTEGMYALKKFVNELLGALLAGATAGALLYAAATKLFDDPLQAVTLAKLTDWEVLPPSLTGAPGEMYLCFAVPVVLAILFVQSAVFVGVTSWFNEEYDREWWGRAAGWVLLAGLVWIVFAAITIYGPVAIYSLPKLFTAVGGGAGLLSILLGKSGTTSSNDREKSEKTSKTETASNLVLGLAGPVFAICILALISLCTSRIVFAVRPPCNATADGGCAPYIDQKDLALRAAGTYEIRESVPLGNGRTRNFATSRFAAADKAQIAAIEHLWTVDTTTIPEGLILVVGLGLFAWIVSFFIGANQFSMHALYRNRLIRGYLGASRTDREPNAFTGFDPTDNFGMDRLRAETFWASTFVDIVRDGPKIIDDATLTGIEKRTRDAVNDAVANPGDAGKLAQARELLAINLNYSIHKLVLTPAGDEPQPVANRKFLEAKYPGAFRPMTLHERPLHVINTALNLVAGDDLAWQERKAESFTVSPLHTGASRLGYRPTWAYGGPSGVSIGTAVAISGAAASPNMGYHSSPALSFLLTLFNVRLGWWYGNPAKDKWTNRNPANTLQTVLSEAFGHTNDQNDYVYLSDGGHFENLALYEMVQRRCGCIVVSDAGADPDFGFDDLGNAIRKIRIDLGIDIVITHMQLFPRSRSGDAPKYCATALIRYSAVDPGAKDGRLLYFKPAFYGASEPKDVYNYATTYPTFPHQSTGDQWFSESQFESYRQLGFFAAGEVANGKKEFATVCALIDAAEKYIDPNDGGLESAPHEKGQGQRTDGRS
jgi:hypothetical protein